MPKLIQHCSTARGLLMSSTSLSRTRASSSVFFNCSSNKVCVTGVDLHPSSVLICTLSVLICTLLFGVKLHPFGVDLHPRFSVVYIRLVPHCSMEINPASSSSLTARHHTRLSPQGSIAIHCSRVGCWPGGMPAISSQATLALALSLGLLMMSCGALTYPLFSFMIVAFCIASGSLYHSARYSFTTWINSSMLLMTT